MTVLKTVVKDILKEDAEFICQWQIMKMVASLRTKRIFLEPSMW